MIFDRLHSGWSFPISTLHSHYHDQQTATGCFMPHASCFTLRSSKTSVISSPGRIYYQGNSLNLSSSTPHALVIISRPFVLQVPTSPTSKWGGDVDPLSYVVVVYQVSIWEYVILSFNPLDGWLYDTTGEYGIPAMLHCVSPYTFPPPISSQGQSAIDRRWDVSDAQYSVQTVTSEHLASSIWVMVRYHHLRNVLTVKISRIGWANRKKCEINYNLL